MNQTITINRDSLDGIQKQIYCRVKELIESGSWAAGFKIPASRDLAKELKVARTTVKQAYSQLFLEGYLVSLDRQGTYVRELTIKPSEAIIRAPQREVLSRYGTEVATMALGERSSPSKIEVSLFSRQPDFDKHQFESVRAALFKELKSSRVTETSTSALGCRRLREAIATIIAPMREINCTADQVAIVPGFSDALDLITRLHVDVKDQILLEEPCYPSMRENAIAYGAQWASIPTDREGLRVDLLPPHGAASKLAFVTPGHHFPTGGVLPYSRRLRLLEWARETGAYIVEDDYDSEFTYAGKPAPALKSLDRFEQVIYVSSFKKLVPSLFSVDFLILPKALISVYARAILLSVTQPSMETQRALASFIKSGSMTGHIKRLKLAYARRRQLLINALVAKFGDNIQISADSSGLHFLIQLRSSLSQEAIVHAAAARGLEISDTREFYAGAAPKGEFIVGFGALEDEQIDEAAEKLKLAAGLA